MVKNIYIIRHGQSEANAGLASDGPNNIPLTQKGFNQAVEIAEKFTESPSLIVHSSFLRTLQTATPLISKYPAVPLLRMDLHEYKFLSPEDFANTTMNDRKYAVREFWQLCDPDVKKGSETESFREFGSRIVTCLNYLMNSPYDTIVVFTHSQVVRIMWQYLITGKSSFDKETMLFFRDKMCHLQIENGEMYNIKKTGGEVRLSPGFEPDTHTGPSFWLQLPA